MVPTSSEQHSTLGHLSSIVAVAVSVCLVCPSLNWKQLLLPLCLFFFFFLVFVFGLVFPLYLS